MNFDQEAERQRHRSQVPIASSLMESFFEQAEHFIRQGQFDEVEKLLNSLGKVDRKSAVKVANIARRINRLSLALKLLHPIVRTENKLQEPASVQEKIEYADTLRQLGAVDEAWQLLKEVDPKQVPSVLLHQAFCLFNQWKYEEALPLLREYVIDPTLEPYVRFVGQLNLAATLVTTGRFPEAKDLLQRLREDTKTENLFLLYGSCLELSAQVLIFENQYDKALDDLNEATEVLKRSGRVASLYVEKWKAIAESLKQKATTTELLTVFERAQKTRHWETVRDCTLYLAFIDQDHDRFQELYFGTPFLSFRERVCKFAGENFQIPANYLWSDQREASIILNLSSGQVQGLRNANLPLGQALHRLMILLCQDFYKPLLVMSAFGKLFPSEYLNATTSPNRVHQIVRRCRKWIDDSGLPLEIVEEEGAYRLLLKSGMGILIPAQILPLTSEEIGWNFLKSQVGRSSFDVHRASEILSCSSSNAKILLRWAVASGVLEKHGSASKTTYKVKHS